MIELETLPLGKETTDPKRSRDEAWAFLAFEIDLQKIKTTMENNMSPARAFK
jgi:hypothetical protein